MAAFTGVTVERGTNQFQGAFKEMWKVKGTVNFDSVAAGAEDSETITVPGINFGDMPIGLSTSISPGGSVQWEIRVTAADTLTVRITNLHASNAADLGSMEMKVLVVRPNW